MKKVISMLLTGVMSLGLTACSGYSYSYSAVGFVKQNIGDHCQADFMKLTGRYVFNLKSNDKNEGDLHYTASLEEGEFNVYYDSLGVKELLFNVKAGETVDAVGGYWESGRTVYVIIETVTPCEEGHLFVELN